MCSSNNNDAAFRCGSLCSIPEECDLDSFATAEPRADHLRTPFPSSSAVRRRVEAARGGPRCDALLEEQRVFHRSPVSLDNGYKPVGHADLCNASANVSHTAQTLSNADKNRETPAPERGFLSLAMSVLCRVGAVLGVAIGLFAALFALAVGILLARDLLGWR